MSKVDKSKHLSAYQLRRQLLERLRNVQIALESERGGRRKSREFFREAGGGLIHPSTSRSNDSANVMEVHTNNHLDCPTTSTVQEIDVEESSQHNGNVSENSNDVDMNSDSVFSSESSDDETIYINNNNDWARRDMYDEHDSSSTETGDEMSEYNSNHDGTDHDYEENDVYDLEHDNSSTDTVFSNNSAFWSVSDDEECPVMASSDIYYDYLDKMPNNDIENGTSDEPSCMSTDGYYHLNDDNCSQPKDSTGGPLKVTGSFTVIDAGFNVS